MLIQVLFRIFWDEAVTGISEIHSFNIIHMDVKPDNFILVNGVVKVWPPPLTPLLPKIIPNVLGGGVWPP